MFSSWSPTAALVDGIPVAEQHRVALAIRHDGRGEACEHVGSVDVVGDATKPLWLTLCAEVAAGNVQAFAVSIARVYGSKRVCPNDNRAVIVHVA